MKTDKQKILMAGGGSGGHVFPLLNVYEIMKKNYEVLFVGENKGKEEKWVSERGIAYRGILAGKMRRYWSWDNLVDIFKLPIGIVQSLYIINNFRPQVVFVKGGYVSLPVAIAAWMLRIPILVHESDMVMGLSNRVIGKIATKIAVSFPIGGYDSRLAKKMIYTGLPVRDWKVKSENIDVFKNNFGISNDLPVIFVTGASQGAIHINDYIFRYVDSMLEYANVIHQTGELDYERIALLAKNKKGKGVYIVKPFLTDDFNRVMYLADMVVARSGATTLAEISSLAKPSILIPLPTSASNHQYFNAKTFEDIGAAVMVEERDFDRINLAILIKSILEDEERFEEMSAAAVTAMQTEGASQIINDIIVDMIK
ncbi:MAG TPA: undecaprenyldiphospho-muramoylpentapeptide beta-N-acetylglucosaminyltransferase [bacterium]|nr:undecaprenyldiphospho-muramoylpentapeptide beta-N-acetylglucosaminyltransferase [bacterium]HPN67691.1 undecaprenyldiphospho-muramoylpentapeptide beta-N-acetylglucosaminyltransferase [bacterium]